MNTSKLSFDELRAIQRALSLDLKILRAKYESANLRSQFPKLSGSVQAYDELPFLSQQVTAAEGAATKITYMIAHHPERPSFL